jgi:hypothetical protein
LEEWIGKIEAWKPGPDPIGPLHGAGMATAYRSMLGMFRSRLSELRSAEGQRELPPSLEMIQQIADLARMESGAMGEDGWWYDTPEKLLAALRSASPAPAPEGEEKCDRCGAPVTVIDRQHGWPCLNDGAIVGQEASNEVCTCIPAPRTIRFVALRSPVSGAPEEDTPAPAPEETL